jgi:mycofactocin system glycosyltransferase
VATTELVAFLDSDCVAGPGWIEMLSGHFADPQVAAVAPRVVAVAGGSAGGGPARYAAARSPLDMGVRAAPVAPMSRVPYVPTAALLVRRGAFEEVAGFDEALRYGEDVDLVWRLARRGRRVLYDPSASVGHHEPEGRQARWRRRYHYGTSAAPLAARHPGDLAPLIVAPFPAAVVLALLARRPAPAAAAFVAGALALARRTRGVRAGWWQPADTVARGVGQTWLAAGRFGGQFLWPALVGAVARPGGRGRRVRLGRRLAVASLLAGPPLVEWVRRRPSLDPLRFSAAYLADEAAYGLGVYRGSLRTRSWAALRPRVLLGRGARPSVPTLPNRASINRPTIRKGSNRA